MTGAPLDAALYYAHRGWAVFRCHEPTPSGCSCRRPDCSSPAKHPRTARGLREATTDPETIARESIRYLRECEERIHHRGTKDTEKSK